MLQNFKRMIPTTKACRRGDMEATLFGCCSDCGACIYACFCPPCADAQAWATSRGEKCGCCHLASFACFTRANIRHARGMELDFCSDCCSSHFCPLCFTVQNIRELKLIQTQAQIPDEQTPIVTPPQNQNYYQPPQNGQTAYPPPQQGYTQQGYPPQGYPQTGYQQPYAQNQMPRNVEDNENNEGGNNNENNENNE